MPMHQPVMDGGASWALALPCCFFPIGLLVLAFWLWMLIDCLTRQFKGNDKIVWVLVILLLNWIGALIYFFVGRSQGTRPQRP